MCSSPKDNSEKLAREDAKRQAKLEAERQARIQAGTAEVDRTFGGFDDAYYDGISNAYKTHYTPLLDEQFTQATQDAYMNPMGGSTNSSAFAQQLEKLETQRQRELADINNRGLAEAQNYRGNVASNRQGLISQVNAGAGVDQVANLAAEQAKSLRAAPVFSGLGDVFAKFTAQAANAANNGAFNTKQEYTPLTFNNSTKNAERNVRSN